MSHYKEMFQPAEKGEQTYEEEVGSELSSLKKEAEVKRWRGRERGRV